jgi:hypothetical protein
MFQVTNPIDQALWGIIIILIVGLMAGSWLNRRRSKKIGLWLQAGLATLGGQTAWRWVRGINSGAQITIEAAGKPFRRLEIGYFLLTRELPPLWGIEWLRGKRDLFTLRGELRQPPDCEVEVVPAAGDLRRKLDAANEGDALRWEDGPARLAIGVRSSGGQAAASKFRPFLTQYGPYLQRLSVRPRRPHVMLFLNLAGLEAAPAAELLRSLRKALE